MRSAAAASLIAIALALACLLPLASPPAAYACSAGTDYNPAAASELIAAGYITDLEIVGRRGIMTYLEVRMTFEVDRYLLGSGPATLLVTDSASAVPPRHLTPTMTAFEQLDLATLDIDDLEYDGGGGACGALDADPRGRYWVVGLSSNTDTGQLGMHRLTTFAIGSGPADPTVLAGIERVRSLMTDAGLVPSPAAAGSAGLATNRQQTPLPARTAASIIALTAGLALARRATSRRERLSSHPR